MTERKGDLQDGMLRYYQEQARASDVNVEARLDREPFDYREVMRRPTKRQAASSLAGIVSTDSGSPGAS
jgi:hypothetical protein